MFARLMTANLGPLLPWLITGWLASLVIVSFASYHKGGEAADARHAIAQASAYGAAVDKVLTLGREFADIGKQLATAMANSDANDVVQVRTVREVIRENPEFAAVRRPAELQRLRNDRLERVARATQAD